MLRMLRTIQPEAPKGYELLANEIVLAAIQDWKRLDSGIFETAQCNYGELTKFFKGEFCEILLHGTGLTGEWILEQLKKERDKTENI